jgi:hypothetical protein
VELAAQGRGELNTAGDAFTAMLPRVTGAVLGGVAARAVKGFFLILAQDGTSFTGRLRKTAHGSQRGQEQAKECEGAKMAKGGEEGG